MMYICGFLSLLFSFENQYFDLTEIVVEIIYTNDISISINKVLCFLNHLTSLFFLKIASIKVFLCDCKWDFVNVFGFVH